MVHHISVLMLVAHVSPVVTLVCVYARFLVLEGRGGRKVVGDE